MRQLGIRQLGIRQFGMRQFGMRQLGTRQLGMVDMFFSFVLVFTGCYTLCTLCTAL